MRLRRFVFVAAVLSFSVPCAWAWNTPTHKVIAEIAYQELGKDDAKRKQLIRILSADKVLVEDFVAACKPHEPPKDEVEFGHQLFLFAATWPDYIKGENGKPRPSCGEAGHKHIVHGEWHYVDLPYRPGVPDDEAAIAKLLAPWDGKAMPDSLARALDLVRSADQKVEPLTPGQRLAWYMHLIGDLHCPVHCTALFSGEGEFAPALKDGDKGGNLFTFVFPFAASAAEHKKKLHAVWDDFIPGKYVAGTWDLTPMKVILDNATLCTEQAGAVAEPRAGERPWADWVREGQAVAKRVAYEEGGILQPKPGRNPKLELETRAMPDGTLRKSPFVALHWNAEQFAAYVKSAHDASAPLVGRAGKRLAQCLKTLPLTPAP